MKLLFLNRLMGRHLDALVFALFGGNSGIPTPKSKKFFSTPKPVDFRKPIDSLPPLKCGIHGAFEIVFILPQDQ
jgi:hypothetical protein